MAYRIIEPRFPLGKVLATTVASSALGQEGLLEILRRHHCGDWGDLGGEDKRANEEALKVGERLLSRYDLEVGSFYILTEADRSITTVMGAEEY